MQTNTQKLEALVRNANSYLNAKEVASQKIVAGFEVEINREVYKEAIESYADAIAKITAIGMNCAEPENVAS